MGENGKWLQTTNEALYEFAREVAASDPKEKDAVIGLITGFFHANIE
ncbi:MAG TPA: hypothetical protein VJ553_03820 [Candidatus Paceibacterota bacterium]|nr:hypothetical protein [Candidatus Paceibacterota bacterium]